MKSDYFQTADNLSMSIAASVRPLLFMRPHTNLLIALQLETMWEYARLGPITQQTRNYH